MDMDMSPPQSPASSGFQKKSVSMMHMTFFWGKEGYILFSGWPGTSTGIYVLALILVFALAVVVEFLPRCRRIQEGEGVARGVVRSLVHATRIGLAYLIMLALMSFNVGVFLVAIAGHMLGFLLFGSKAFAKSSGTPPYVKTTTDQDHTSMNC